MSVLNRFRRASIWSLQVGDVIRFRAYHQSRTGYIVRLRGKGRIETLDRHPTEAPGEQRYVAGRLHDRGNILQGFRLTDDDTVYRQVAARRSSQAPLEQRPSGRERAAGVSRRDEPEPGAGDR